MATDNLAYGEYVTSIRTLLSENYRESASASAKRWGPAASFFEQIIQLNELCFPFIVRDLRSRIDDTITGTPVNPASARQAAQNVLTTIAAAIGAPGAAPNPSPQLGVALAQMYATLNPGGIAHAILANKQSNLGTGPNQLTDSEFIIQLRRDLYALFRKLHESAVGLDYEAAVVAGHLLNIDDWAGVHSDAVTGINTWINRPVGADEEPLKSLADAVKMPTDQNVQKALEETRASLRGGGSVHLVLERFAPPVWRPTSEQETILGYFSSSITAWLPTAAGLLVLVIGLFILALPNDCPPAGISGQQLNLGWTVKGVASANPTKGNPFMCRAEPWREAIRNAIAINYNLIHEKIPGIPKLDEPQRPKSPESPTAAGTQGAPATSAAASASSGSLPVAGTEKNISQPAAANLITPAANELKTRLAWIISYATQLLATFAAIIITFWIIAVAIEDQINPIGYRGSTLSWLRHAASVFCVTAIVAAVIIAFLEYALIHSLFRGQVKHVSVHSIFLAPENNLQWILEERLMPGVQRLLQPANYAFFVAVIGLIAATSITLLQLPNMAARRNAGNDLPYEQYLTRCFQRLTLAIYAGAALLAVSVVQVGARQTWPLSLFDTNPALATAAGQLSLIYGTLFSLFLVALYGPAFMILRRRAWSLVRATEPASDAKAHTEWLMNRNMSFTISQKVYQFIVLLLPASVGIAAVPFLDLLKQ